VCPKGLEEEEKEEEEEEEFFLREAGKLLNFGGFLGFL
jgi:hypothetical protein